MMAHAFYALGMCLMLAACGSPENTAIARIELDQPDGQPAMPTITPSPDLSDAQWMAGTGQQVFFAPPGQQPFFSLACEHHGGQAVMRLTRHVPADEGSNALMPLIGNGRIVRIKVAAVAYDTGFQWEAILPAFSETLDVFAGPYGVEATVPGGGTITMGASEPPARLIAECRAGVLPD